jgi:hypothetical protein
MSGLWREWLRTACAVAAAVATASVGAAQDPQSRAASRPTTDSRPATATVRPAFAAATFLADWDRWSTDAIDRFAAARLLDASSAAAARDEARAAAKAVRELAALSPLEAALENRPAERTQRAVGDAETVLASYVENGRRKRERRRLESLAELKDLRAAVLVRVDATGARRRAAAEVAARLKTLRRRLVPAVRESALRAPAITPFLDLTEDLGLCDAALEAAVAEDEALHRRLRRLLDAYDDAIRSYRG